MTRAERGTEKKKYGKVFASFCWIMKLYFPDFISWFSGLKDPRKFWTYETEVMLMTVIMKNVCYIDSMQQTTNQVNVENKKTLCGNLMMIFMTIVILKMMSEIVILGKEYRNRLY